MRLLCVCWREEKKMMQPTGIWHDSDKRGKPLGGPVKKCISPRTTQQKSENMLFGGEKRKKATRVSLLEVYIQNLTPKLLSKILPVRNYALNKSPLAHWCILFSSFSATLTNDSSLLAPEDHLFISVRCI